MNTLEKKVLLRIDDLDFQTAHFDDACTLFGHPVLYNFDRNCLRMAFGSNIAQ